MIKIISPVIILVLSSVLIFSYSGSLFAEDTSGPYLSYVPSEGIEVQPLGIVAKVATTVVVQGSPRLNKPDYDKMGGSWVAYFDFSKKIEDWGEIFFRLESGIGDTISRGLSLFTGVNYNSYVNGFNLEPRRYWYKQYLLDKQVSFTIGKLESRDYLDKSKYAGDDDRQFLASIFNKSYTIEWPSNYGPAVNINISPDFIDFLELEFNYFDGAAKWEKLGTNNIYTLQLKLKTPPFFSSAGDQKFGGNYRFYTWLNARNHRMQLKVDKDGYYNCGAGFGFDQSVADVYGVFGRVGWQRPDLQPVDGGAEIELSWSAGAQMMGNYWSRKNDCLGIAVGQLFPGRAYQGAGNPAGAEGHAELYYNYELNKCFHISPDFQFVWNPDGVTKSYEGPNHVIFVYGLRMRVDV